MGMRHLTIIIASFCLSASIAFITTGFSFLIMPITTDLQFPVAQFAVYFSLFMMFGVVGLPLWAKITKTIGVKWAVTLSAVLTTGAVVGLSFCRSLPAFYVMGVLIGLFFQGATVMPAVILINTWFIKKKGLILGVVMAGSGVSGAFLSYNFPKFLEAAGWQKGYVLLAAFFFALSVLPALLLIKNKPADCGLKMYGQDETPPSGAPGHQAAARQTTGITLKDAWKTPHLYLLYFGVFLLCVVISFSQYVPAHLRVTGVDVQTLSLLATILMLANIISKIIIGIINDRIGINGTLVLVMVLCALALVIFLPRASGFVFALIGVILFPFGACFSGILPPLQTSAIFGNKDYTAIWGIVGTASSLGMAVGPPIWGSIYDTTGSYVAGMYAAPALIAAGLALCIVAVKTKDKLRTAN
jgi:sugar phosphate permease